MVALWARLLNYCSHALLLPANRARLCDVGLDDALHARGCQHERLEYCAQHERGQPSEGQAIVPCTASQGKPSGHGGFTVRLNDRAAHSALDVGTRESWLVHQHAALCAKDASRRWSPHAKLAGRGRDEPRTREPRAHKQKQQTRTFSSSRSHQEHELVRN